MPATYIYQKRRKAGWCGGCGKVQSETARCNACVAKAKPSIRAWQRKNGTAYQKKYRKPYSTALKQEVFLHYGTSCKCCGESILMLLTIDHIKNDGAQHRREIGSGGTRLYGWLKAHNYPEGFQTLCFSCNAGRYMNGGICPHEASK